MTSLNRSEFDAYKENDTKTNEIPLSFASFYYSLKVSKGKGKIIFNLNF